MGGRGVVGGRGVTSLVGEGVSVLMTVGNTAARTVIPAQHVHISAYFVCL